MIRLWSGAAAAALLAGMLSGCASPRYPIEEGQTPGTSTLSAPRPQYPIDRPAAPAADGAAAPTAAAAPAPSSAAPTPPEPASSAPVGAVDSQPLPPPASGPSAAASTDSAVATPAVATGAPLSPTPVSDTTTSAAPAPATPTSTAPPAAPPAEEPALTPQSVEHDGAPATPGPVVHDGPPANPAPAASPPAPPASPPAPMRVATANMAPTPGYSISGQVVAAQGVFENYEVQRGDHIDALARAFSTTRDILLETNHIRSPYVIVPGQIIKVPVAKAYVAVAGDTLAGVARRFQVNLSELAQLNHLSEHAPLLPGEQVGLPTSMRDSGPIRDYSSYAGNSYATPNSSGNSTGTHPYVPGPAQAPAPGYRVTQVQPAGPPPSQDRGTTYATPQPPAQAQLNMTDAQVAQAAHGRFVWPVRGDILAHFGPQGVGRRNDGVDIRAPSGTPVKAAAPGEVVYAGDQVPGFGNLVLIKHADGWVTAYAHLDQIAVTMKQQVTQGQVVGNVGATGGVPEPELHFEVRYAPNPEDRARPVDPVLVLPTG